jgi:hypothetical protein
MQPSVGVAALATASVVGVLSNQAQALPPTTSLMPAVVLPSAALQLTGVCTPVFLAAGIGSTGGLPYQMNGVALSLATTTTATQIECKFYDTDRGEDLLVVESGFKPGPIAVATSAVVVHTLDNIVACAKAIGSTTTLRSPAPHGRRPMAATAARAAAPSAG